MLRQSFEFVFRVGTRSLREDLVGSVKHLGVLLLAALRSRESLGQAIMLLLISRRSEPISTRNGTVRLLTSESQASAQSDRRQRFSYDGV